MASELRVDKIIPSSGTSIGIGTASGTINILGNSQINTTGVITATTFVGNLTGNPTGSGANLTNLPAGNLTGTVADARISTLTASKLSGALPAISGANLTGLTAGITEFDSWYLTANKTSNGDLTSNLSRQDKLGSASPLGTGMSQSSGVFTFPSTGKWLVIVEATFVCNGADNVTLDTYVTTNNSSYTHTHRAIDGLNGSGDKHGSGTSFCFLDVTDTSQVKVKFAAGSVGSGSYITAEQSYVQTGFHFIRIGNT